MYLLVLPHPQLDGGFQRQILCLDSLLYVRKFNLIYLYQCVPGTQQEGRAKKENGPVITLCAWSQLCPAAPLWG